MEDPAERLLDALDRLGEVADELTAEEAAEALDQATLQTFWMQWPRTSSWAGALWRRLNTELAEPAAVSGDADLDETGGGD